MVKVPPSNTIYIEFLEGKLFMGTLITLLEAGIKIGLGNGKHAAGNHKHYLKWRWRIALRS